MSAAFAKPARLRVLSDLKLRSAILRTGPQESPAWIEFVRRYSPIVSQAVAVTLTRLGVRPHADLVEDIVAATWLRITRDGHRVLRAWNPIKGEKLGTFLARLGVWETRSSRRLWRCRKEVKLDEDELRRIADRRQGSLGPVEVAQIKESEGRVQCWESKLEPLERTLLELRKAGAPSREIGLFLNRDHKTICTILNRLQQRLSEILALTCLVSTVPN